jgi:small multidrug resistance pump
MRPSGKRSRAADDRRADTRAGPFAPVLGSYRDRLARPLADQFLGADRGHRVRLDGTMHQIWRRHGWLRPLFTVLAWADILFPETGRDVPVSLTIEPDGRGDDVWRRTFAFARERRFNATMAYRGSGVIERLGPHGMLEVPWHLRVTSADAIQITTGETCVRFRRLRLRLRFPRWLRFTVAATQRARPHGRMDLDLVVTHPHLGRIFGYSGTFTVQREALEVAGPGKSGAISLDRYRPWFYAAAGYNLTWGGIAILWPSLFFRLLRMPPPDALAVWQALGMMVLVYAPAYWWLARDPVRHRHLALVALLGKLLGPMGFLWAVASHLLPVSFGVIIVANDLVWWPAFIAFVVDAAQLCGGWRALLAGR